jgi:hypothetical protein
LAGVPLGPGRCHIEGDVAGHKIKALGVAQRSTKGGVDRAGGSCRQYPSSLFVFSSRTGHRRAFSLSSRTPPRVGTTCFSTMYRYEAFVVGLSEMGRRCRPATPSGISRGAYGCRRRGAQRRGSVSPGSACPVPPPVYGRRGASSVCWHPRSQGQFPQPIYRPLVGTGRPRPSLASPDLPRSLSSRTPRSSTSFSPGCDGPGRHRQTEWATGQLPRPTDDDGCSPPTP